MSLHASFVFPAGDLAQPIQGRTRHGWRTTRGRLMVKHYLRVDLPDSIYLLDGFCMRQKKKDMYVDFAQPDGLKLLIVLPSLLMEQRVTSVGRGPVNPWFQLWTLLFTLLNLIKLSFFKGLECFPSDTAPPKASSFHYNAVYINAELHSDPKESFVSCCMLAIIQRTAQKE